MQIPRFRIAWALIVTAAFCPGPVRAQEMDEVAESQATEIYKQEVQATTEGADAEGGTTTTSAPARKTPAKIHKPLVDPVGFGIVCGWILACLYCATYTQHKKSYSAGQKGIINLVLLLTGPIGLVVLVIVQRNPKLKEQLTELLDAVASARPGGPLDAQDAPELELCTGDGAPVHQMGGRNAPAREALEIAKRIVQEALDRHASDILVDPRDGGLHQVRYRVDGMLQEVASFPVEQGQAIINCLKVASRLDISEKRRPQDGAFIAKLEDRKVKFRSATAGTLYGEKMAVRVFDVQSGLRDLSNLGLSGDLVDKLSECMKRSNGMVLIAGPTGSGKTTTIYAALDTLADSGRNIVTIEDPIEYPLAHASQMQINPRAGITFASGLRSMLRQDPDVILVGEIRDAETATTALQASQTGHLVVSTIHSNDSPTALARLVDIGIEPFLISTGLTAVLSQRLVRALCTECKRPARITPKLRREAARRQIALGKISVAVGCDRCNGTGYSGRTAIFEYLPLSQKMGQLLTKKPSLATIQAQVRAEKMVTLRQSGMVKVLQGVTTVEEVMRVASR